MTTAAHAALVLCVGNELAADDAVGAAVYERLQAAGLPATVRLERLALGGLRLLDALRGEQLLVVVDATCTGASPGTVFVQRWSELTSADGMPLTSHDIGPREALEIGALLYPERMPAEVVLVGVEGASFSELGAGLSPAVAAAVASATAAVLEATTDSAGKALI